MNWNPSKITLAISKQGGAVVLDLMRSGGQNYFHTLLQPLLVSKAVDCVASTAVLRDLMCVIFLGSQCADAWRNFHGNGRSRKPVAVAAHACHVLHRRWVGNARLKVYTIF